MPKEEYINFVGSFIVEYNEADMIEQMENIINREYKSQKYRFLKNN